MFLSFRMSAKLGHNVTVAVPPGHKGIVAERRLNVLLYHSIEDVQDKVNKDLGRAIHDQDVLDGNRGGLASWPVRAFARWAPWFWVPDQFFSLLNNLRQCSSLLFCTCVNIPIPIFGH